MARTPKGSVARMTRHVSSVSSGGVSASRRSWAQERGGAEGSIGSSSSSCHASRRLAPVTVGWAPGSSSPSTVVASFLPAIASRNCRAFSRLIPMSIRARRSSSHRASSARVASRAQRLRRMSSRSSSCSSSSAALGTGGAVRAWAGATWAVLGGRGRAAAAARVRIRAGRWGSRLPAPFG